MASSDGSPLTAQAPAAALLSSALRFAADRHGLRFRAALHSGPPGTASGPPGTGTGPPSSAPGTGSSGTGTGPGSSGTGTGPGSSGNASAPRTGPSGSGTGTGHSGNASAPGTGTASGSSGTGTGTGSSGNASAPRTGPSGSGTGTGTGHSGNASAPGTGTGSGSSGTGAGSGSSGPAAPSPAPALAPATAAYRPLTGPLFGTGGGAGSSATAAALRRGGAGPLAARLPGALIAFLADAGVAHAAQSLHIIGALAASPITSLCILAIDQIAEVDEDRAEGLRFFLLTPYVPYSALRVAMRSKAAPFRGGEACDVFLAYGSGAPEVWGRAAGSDGERFFIARGVEEYLRLGAAFAWVYGWQLCYAAQGPPQRSLPWLHLLAPAALAAAREAHK